MVALTLVGLAEMDSGPPVEAPPMQSLWRGLAAALIIGAIVAAALGGSGAPATAKRHPAPSPTPLPSGASPTPVPTPVPSPSLSPGAQPPTPYMPLELIPNGTWLVIEQGAEWPTYSQMTLKDVGTAISGTWEVDKKTKFYVSGTRNGSHMQLTLTATADPKAPSVGKIDATLDGIADMFGLITLNGKDTPFQGAQHSRVPPPVEAPQEQTPTPGPFGDQPPN